MKKVIIIIAMALIATPLLAANVEVSYSGPSGQGDVIYKAKSTGTTNMAMGVSGLYNITINPSYAVVFGDLTLNNAIIRTNATVGGTLTVTGSITGPISAANLTAGTVANAIDGSGVTNIAGGNIASGDISSDRMTANAVVVSDFTADGGIQIGTGAGTFEEIKTGHSGNFTFLSANATTGRIWCLHGIVTNVVTSGE